MDMSKLHDRLRAKLPDKIGDLRALARDHAPEAVRQREAGYSITNLADESVVRIYDEIWWLGVNALDLVAELDTITSPKIRVEINSPGGDVFDGIAIYNALRNHPAHVTTRVDGIAASIASVIAQAGDHRIMQPAAQMMIHNAWGMTVGDTKDHGDMSALLEQQDAVIAGIYAARSGGDVAHFRDLMNAESWLTADTAVSEGLADVIVDPAPKPNPDASQRRTLHDELADTMDVVSAAIASAERVVALRADAGKDVSNRNHESLVGLRDELVRLDNLLNTPPEPAADAWTQDELDAMRRRLDVLATVR